MTQSENRIRCEIRRKDANQTINLCPSAGLAGGHFLVYWTGLPLQRKRYSSTYGVQIYASYAACPILNMSMTGPQAVEAPA